MSLHFLSDQCVPAEISETLEGQGYRVTRLREVLPVRAPDTAVIAKAQELGAILLSLNGDFSDILAYPPSNYGGIVSVQLHDHPEIIPQLLRGFLSFLAAHPDQDFYRGILLLVEVHRLRIRRT